MGTVKPSKGFLKGSKGSQPVLKELQRLSKASKRVSKAFEGTQRLSMEPPESFGSSGRASSSFPNHAQATTEPSFFSSANIDIIIERPSTTICVHRSSNHPNNGHESIDPTTLPEIVSQFCCTS